MTLNIPVILGTARDGRASEQAARFVHSLMQKSGADSEFIDVRDYTRAQTLVDWMDNAEDTQKWIATAEAADGFIIVAPEYNHFFPGELKIFLDQTLDPYKHKPVGLAGVSNGQWGATRMIEHLRALVVRLGMVTVHPSAYFPNIKDAFTRDNEAIDPKLAEYTQPMIDEVLWYAQALAHARAQKSE